MTSRHNCLKRRLFSNYVDLSDRYVDLSDNDFDLSDIKLTSTWQLVALTRYKNKIFIATSCDYIFLTSRQ